jgi:putative phosphoribosyl transferase
MLFHDRQEAAGLLTERLAPYRGRSPLVLGLPRAGVLMAREVAENLRGDLDVLLVRRLRAPDRREIAIGAVAENGTAVVVKRPYAPEIPSAYVEAEKREALAALRSQRAVYTPGRRATSSARRVVILVDDGAAAGSAGLDAALRALREAGPARLIVATAVAAPGRVAACKGRADEVICLAQPAYFGSVSRFYMDYPEVSDAAAVDAVNNATRARRLVL